MLLKLGAVEVCALGVFLVMNWFISIGVFQVVESMVWEMLGGKWANQKSCSKHALSEQWFEQRVDLITPNHVVCKLTLKDIYAFNGVTKYEYTYETDVKFK